MKKLSHIYIFHVLYHEFANVKNHAYWQKLFRYELRLQEPLGTISRSGTDRSDLEMVEYIEKK